MGPSRHWFSPQWEEWEREPKLLMGSPDSGKEGTNPTPSHWLDAMCAEFQLIEIGNHVPPWGSISIPQQTGQC